MISRLLSHGKRKSVQFEHLISFAGGRKFHIKDAEYYLDYSKIKSMDEIKNLIAFENSCNKMFDERTRTLRQTLRKEIKTRSNILLCEEERIGNYIYSSEANPIKQTSELYRWSAASDSKSDIRAVLDLEYLSRFGHLQVLKHSPDHRLIAAILSEPSGIMRTLVLVDTEENNKLEKIFHFKEFEKVYGCTWGAETLSVNGCYSIFYSVQDSAGRPCEVRAIKIYLNNNKRKKVQLNRKFETIYSEKCEKFFVDVNSTKDQKLIVISSNSKVTSEVRIIPNELNCTIPILLFARNHGIEYYVEHNKGTLYVVSNHACSPEEHISVRNFSKNSSSCPIKPKLSDEYRIFSVPLEDINSLNFNMHGVLCLQCRYFPQNGFIEDIDMFSNFVAIYEMNSKGYPQIVVLPLPLHTKSGNEKPKLISRGPFEFPQCTSLRPLSNLFFESNTVRFSLSYVFQPPTIHEVCMETGRIIKVDEGKLSGESNVVSLNDVQFSRVLVKSYDDIEVPLTLACKCRVKLDGTNPSVLFGYGSYGHPIPLDYRGEYVSLLERGWVLAWAHVRGGNEKGKQWHEDGRGLKKKNTFRDFEACAEYLITNGYTTSRLMTAHTHSAGCLIGGFIANERPDLFRAIVMVSPFLDPLHTLMDKTLPLSVHEYDEFGNPEMKEVYDYIKSYSPCDNVRPQQYPRMLISSCVDDQRVGYWEAVKWAYLVREAVEIYESSRSLQGSCSVERSNARAPAFERDGVILRINEEGGHVGAVDWPTQLSNLSYEIAFLIDSVEQKSTDRSPNSSQDLK